MASDYPDFDGWTVERRMGANARTEFLFTKPHPRGKAGRLTVWSSIGYGKDPEIAYLAGKRDALAEDVRVSGDPDLYDKLMLRQAILQNGESESARQSYDNAYAAFAASTDEGTVDRFNAAHRAVVAGKVRRGVSKGFGRDYALNRLDKAGFSLKEIGDVIGPESEPQPDSWFRFRRRKG
jgi:hypothetical protein